MLPLDDPHWSELSDAYGASSGIPALLEAAEKLPSDLGDRPEPYFSLWSALCHQGDIYTASYAAVPHLVRIVAENPRNFRSTLLALVQAIEAARLDGRGPAIPERLRDAYSEAIKRITSIAETLMRGNTTESDLRFILSACATAKGFASLGNAIGELTPEVTARLLEDWIYR